jgi:hypothetical protein
MRCAMFFRSTVGMQRNNCNRRIRSPGVHNPTYERFEVQCSVGVLYGRNETEVGVMRESNSRPPAPEAGIIPLDQSPSPYSDGRARRPHLHKRTRAAKKLKVGLRSVTGVSHSDTTKLTLSLCRIVHVKSTDTVMKRFR